MPPEPSVLLHLSDLHLGENLEDTGSDSKGSVQSTIRTRFVQMQCHDPYVVHALPTELLLAARAAGAPRDTFDLVVVTGDISTNARTTTRFTFARKYLLDGVPTPEGRILGLRFQPGTLFCVPGNHDKLLEPSLERYLTAFNDLPEPPPYVREHVTRAGQKFVFFGLDSNTYEEGNIAVGKITPGGLGLLTTAIEDSPPDAIRILLLHHHPADLNQFRGSIPLIERILRGRFTVLDDADRLMDACAHRVDIIMHGHEHFPVAFESRGCVVVSAGTTCEWQPGKGKNSFHVLTFRDDALRVDQFDWGRGRFRMTRAYAFARDPMPHCWRAV